MAKEIVRYFAARDVLITFAWIPSHVEITGNENADIVAKQGSILLPTPHLKVPMKDVQNCLKSELFKHRQMEWDLIPRTNKLRSIRNTITPWTTSLQENRKEQVALSRLRLGHTKITHGFLLDRSPAPICQNCNLQITVSYLLYQNIRQKYSLSTSLEQILSDNPDKILSLMKFLKSSHFLLKI
ncbi:hypothetical protein PGB90_001210 [Kerria lacca]